MAAAKDSKKLSDQRLQERFSLELPVKVSVSAETDRELQYQTVTANISAGGAFIATNQPLPIASKVYLEFLLSFNDLKKLRFILSLEMLKTFAGKPVWVLASGVVIRHQANGMAVIFDQDYQLSPLEGSAE